MPRGRIVEGLYHSVAMSGLAALIIGGVLSPSLVCASQSPPSSPATASAMRLLRDNCFSCHNEDKRKGGLVLTSPKNLAVGADSEPVIDPNSPGQSLLYQVLLPEADPHMPPKQQLTERQIESVKDWISGGAAWDQAVLDEEVRREFVLTELPDRYQPVLALALSPDGKRLAVGRGSQLLVHDLDADEFPVLVETNAHIDAVRAIAWSPDGRQLATGSHREITVRNADDLSMNWRVADDLLGRIGALTFTPFGGALVAADNPPAQTARVRVFAAENGRVLDAWSAHHDTINALAISPDGGRLATAGGDRLVKLWELVSHTEIARYEGHLGAVTGVAFNKDATELLSVGADRQFRVWDVASRESVVTIGGRSHSFTAGRWSADGTTVVASDEDGRLYSFKEFKRHSGAQSSETAKERRLGRWEDALHAVAVNADATRIVAGGQDGIVRIVNDDGKLIAKLEPAATPEEEAQPASEEEESEAEAAAESAPSFVYDVLPLMAKAGCMAGSCHAKPEGQNGFKLSVFNHDPRSDYAEIVKDGRGRRVFPSAPAESLLLLKPTHTVDHEGGQRFEPGSKTYETLARWIAAGMPYQHPDEPTLTGIRVEPGEGSFRKGRQFALKVTAHYSDDSIRDVTGLAEFVSQDKELATVDEDGVVKVGRLTGENVVLARFMGRVDAARITVPADQLLPPERYRDLPVANYIDELAYEHFQKLGLFPSARCSDEEFIRRSTLDTIGRLPTVEEVKSFLADTSPDKRRHWIDHLLEQPEWADYWANQWADLLRPNPDRVGVKSVYLLDQWLREAFRKNTPFDEFARAFLTVEGSNHRDGPAVVYRDRREPPELTTLFSQLFLGVRMECAKCHHHPNEKWSQEDFYRFAAFFGPVKQKGKGLSPPISAGTEMFYFASGGEVKHPVTDAVLKPAPLDGPVFEPSEDQDPRLALADWIIDPDNPWFARSAVNRVWASFFGRGMVEPVDDFRTSNPPVNEPLLDSLAADFIRQDYDLQQLMRTILTSGLYQLSSTPNDANLADTKNFSRSYRRRLPAEVMLDAVCDVTGVPEQFEGCPPGTRAIQTWTFKINSHFLDAFGRPDSSSDPPCERDPRTSVVQALHMMNSRGLQAKLADADGRVTALAASDRPPEQIVNELYLAAFSRLPTEEELSVASAEFDGEETDRKTATEDLLWALLNSPEFVFNH